MYAIPVRGSLPAVIVRARLRELLPRNERMLGDQDSAR